MPRKIDEMNIKSRAIIVGTACLLLLLFRTTTFVDSFSAKVSVSSRELDQRLTTELERTVVKVVRQCGPGVAYVTSVWPTSESSTSTTLPAGRNLGSGSGFVISSRYVVTNYHVIEAAYQIQTRRRDMEQLWSNFTRNLTRWKPATVPNPIVLVRIDSATQYLPCRIVQVDPSLDCALLKITAPDVTPQSLTFGSSSDLLVGQGLVAIGNPFGLDNTVTTGVVSALNRDINMDNRRIMNAAPLRNCIQTDCAINPGNSGGPLLNLQGQVVGMNTAIYTTSGSSSGIGFAVPSDAMVPFCKQGMRRDQNVAWLGVSVVQSRPSAPDTKCPLMNGRNWVTLVVPSSPAAQAGIRPITISRQTGTVTYGDAIVAVNSNPVDSFEALWQQMEQCVPDENIQLTLESVDGERRVVYVKLSERPEAK
jgi:S1-C subfamily serine protease